MTVVKLKTVEYGPLPAPFFDRTLH
jgi:hypothetical protein